MGVRVGGWWGDGVVVGQGVMWVVVGGSEGWVGGGGGRRRKGEGMEWLWWWGAGGGGLDGGGGGGGHGCSVPSLLPDKTRARDIWVPPAQHPTGQDMREE